VEEGEGDECVEREGEDPLGEERRAGVVAGIGSAHGWRWWDGIGPAPAE
jgi:hypothetical protein